MKFDGLFLVVDFRELAGIEVRRDRVLHLNMTGVKGRAEQGMIGEAVVRETAERFVRGMNLRARHLPGKLPGTTKWQSPQMLVRMHENANRHAPRVSGINQRAELLLLPSLGLVSVIRSSWLIESCSAIQS